MLRRHAVEGQRLPVKGRPPGELERLPRAFWGQQEVSSFARRKLLEVMGLRSPRGSADRSGPGPDGIEMERAVMNDPAAQPAAGRALRWLLCGAGLVAVAGTITLVARSE